MVSTPRGFFNHYTSAGPDPDAACIPFLLLFPSPCLSNASPSLFVPFPAASLEVGLTRCHESNGLFFFPRVGGSGGICSSSSWGLTCSSISIALAAWRRSFTSFFRPRLTRSVDGGVAGQKFCLTGVIASSTFPFLFPAGLGTGTSISVRASSSASSAASSRSRSRP